MDDLEEELDAMRIAAEMEDHLQLDSLPLNYKQKSVLLLFSINYSKILGTRMNERKETV